MPVKLIIDADPGIGDALAIAVAALDPAIDLIGITATSGCVSGPVATQNILALIEQIDPPKLPRLGGSTANRPGFDGLSHIGFLDPLRLNGNYGLGTHELEFTQLHNQRESARVLIDLVRNHPHEVTILTLGPLTNIAVACELASDFCDLVRSIVCLAGSVGAGGDAAAAAEFNVLADPVSARNVFAAPATKILVPLDVTNQVIVSFDQINRLRQGRPASLKWFFDDLIPFALRAHHEELGLEGMPIREVTALTSIVEPRHFESRTLSVEVEQQGWFTRGATVFDQRGKPGWQRQIDVLMSVDTHGVLDYLNRVMQSAR